MPIYEFYCASCNTIFNFLSRSVNTEKCPSCPACKSTVLDRKVSRFAVGSRSKAPESEGSGDDMLNKLPIDESKMESAMESLASEAGSIDENDPKSAVRLMRKFSDMTGLRYKDSMEQALARLESGEDPDTIEKDMGDMLQGDELPFELSGGKKNSPPKKPPKHDETLYEL